jgi:hypothetical protein
MKDFWLKNTENFTSDLMSTINFGELFKPGVLNPQRNANLLGMDLGTLFSHNPLILSTLESFKNFSRTLNMNFPFSNVIKYFLNLK